MSDLPPSMEKELEALGLKSVPKHAPVTWPKKPRPKDEFCRPVFDENGQPNF